MAFARKITTKIEKLQATIEGQENPRTVDILKDIDAELQALKAGAKPSAKPKK